MLPSFQPEGRSPTAEILIDLLQEEALLPTIKYINMLAGITAVGRRDDLLQLLKRKSREFSQERITILVAETLRDLVSRHKKSSVLFLQNTIDLDTSVRVDCLESAKSYIRQFEDAIGTSLASYYKRLHDDGSTNWKTYTDTDVFDDYLEKPGEQHIDTRLVCFDNRQSAIVNKQFGPDIVRFCTNVYQIVSSATKNPRCKCIHCFLRSTFNNNRIVRVLQAFLTTPSDRRQPRSFEISREEYSAIQNDTLRAALYLVDVEKDAFYMSEKRIRLWLNGVDVFFIQHDFSTLELNLKVAIRVGSNRLTMSDASSSCFFIVAGLYQPLTCESCIQMVLDHSAASVESDKAAFVARMKEDEDGAALDTVCFRYSLLDPLTYQRMEHPVRSSDCAHLNCFDLKDFLQMYLGKEKMACPVCYKPVRIEDLVQDAFVLSILTQTSPEEEEVEMRQDGEWSHCPVRPEQSDESEPETPVRRVEKPLVRPTLRTQRSQDGPSIESFFRSKRFSLSAPTGCVSASRGLAGSGELTGVGSGSIVMPGVGSGSIAVPGVVSSCELPNSSHSTSISALGSPESTVPMASPTTGPHSAFNLPNPVSSLTTTVVQPTQSQLLNALLSFSNVFTSKQSSNQPEVIDLCDDSSDDQQCTIISLSDSSPVFCKCNSLIG